MSASKTEVDLDVIVPPEEPIEIAGIQCSVRRLRAREFLKVLGIVTTGLGSNLGQVKLSTDDSEQMTSEIIGLFILAIPAAAEQTIGVLADLVEPVKKADRAKLAVEMQNPDPGTVLDILTRMAVQEVDDFAELLGKAKTSIQMIQGIYRKK